MRICGLPPRARRLIRFWNALDAKEPDGGWRTAENGKHYRINSEGEITAGPRAMVGENVNESRGVQRQNETAAADVTEEYRKSATPGIGTFACANPKDRTKYPAETQIGEWIVNTFGGDVVMLPQRGGADHDSHPDYLWRGRLWDLKKPESLGGLDKLIHHGIHQIKSNPGGLILDLSDSDIDVKSAVSKLSYRVRRSASFSVDTIIIRKRDEHRVIRVHGGTKKTDR
ncbi:MAG: hypothetical protein IKE04_05780 [Oscillospiraceae bacterium]|nr:hypothetical protein [Oscillospiraceae bacterium]